MSLLTAGGFGCGLLVPTVIVAAINRALFSMNSGTATITVPIRSEAHDFSVDWGDGTIENFQGSSILTIAHIYATSGLKQIEITGDTFPGFFFNNGAYKTHIQSLSEYYSTATDASVAWRGCSSLTSFPQFNFSLVTNAIFAWRGCSSLTSFPQFNFSSVTNASNAWRGCSSLTSFPQLDFSSVTNTSDAWRDCSSLTSFPQLDFSSVTNASNAWYGCSSLTSFPANFFDACLCTNFERAFESSTLDQNSVDNILISIESNGTSNGTLGINGGVSAAPSAVGLAAKDALISRGWTVTTN